MRHTTAHALHDVHPIVGPGLLLAARFLDGLAPDLRAGARRFLLLRVLDDLAALLAAPERVSREFCPSRLTRAAIAVRDELRASHGLRERARCPYLPPLTGDSARVVAALGASRLDPVAAFVESGLRAVDLAAPIDPFLLPSEERIHLLDLALGWSVLLPGTEADVLEHRRRVADVAVRLVQHHLEHAP